jgi:hypothetical protein
MSPVLYETVYMRGGWDLSTPTLELYPGVLRDVQNFEVSAVTAGGYARIAGYERYDGRTAPTSATFFMIQLVSFVNIPTVGQTLTGFTSGATGVILAIASNYLILTKITGSFTNSEIVKVGGTTIGTATTNTTVLSALLTAQYTQLAADNYRADIAAVPGSGPVRGVFSASFGGADTVYAFRDNAGATGVDLYKSSAGGWVNVPYFKEISLTAGGPNATFPVDGDVLTQGGVTATIKRVMLQTGSWANGSGAGRLIITTPAGGNFAGGAATIGAASVAVNLSGIQTSITMTVGGKFEFDLDNFAGQSATIRIYGCDGVNRGFEFDGTTLAPITTGTSPDSPKHVRAHHGQLFFAFLSSIIHSGPQTPFKWTAVDGAGELACGDVVTNLVTQTGGTTTDTLIATTRSDTKILYGTSVKDWNLVSIGTGIGGIDYSIQQLNQSYWMDASGVFNTRAVQEFGNFRQATMTNAIQDYVTTQRSKVSCSVVNRSKNQYRLLFTDANSLYMTIVNGKMAGLTKIIYKDVMYCAWSSNTSVLNERVFCGANSSGYVYQMDQGSSFDGSVIDAFMVFNWNPMKTPRIRKAFRRASVEMQGNFYASLSLGYALGYGTTEILQPPDTVFDSGFLGAPAWDSVSWDSFNWDGVTLKPSEVKLYGRAENIQITLRSGTNYIQPYVVNSLIINYSLGRGVR